MALLDAIFDGLTDEDDGALRDFCAEAAREFLLWSAKHVTAKASQAGANLNAASLLRRLFERLAHPKPYQRCNTLTLDPPRSIGPEHSRRHVGMHVWSLRCLWYGSG